MAARIERRTTIRLSNRVGAGDNIERRWRLARAWLRAELGNVWEWCLDWYGDYWYEDYRTGGGEVFVDPVRLERGGYSRRVDRGGSFEDTSARARSAGPRGTDAPWFLDFVLGLRPAKRISP